MFGTNGQNGDRFARFATFFVLPGVSMITIVMTLTTRFLPTKIRSLVLNNPWLFLGWGVVMMQLTSDVIQHLFVVRSYLLF